MIATDHQLDRRRRVFILWSQRRLNGAFAARFGVTPQVVRQRLKLAVVSPKLIAAYRKGGMTLDCLMAFTVSDDHKQQERVWSSLLDYARERPGHIRNLLTEKHVSADRQAGAFRRHRGLRKRWRCPAARPDGNTWLTDPALLDKLGAEKLEQAAETVRSEGWKWVEIIPDLDWEPTKGFGHAEAERLPPSAEQQQQIETLTAEGNAIIAEHARRHRS
jgi:ParB family transcriptional regulator, chromosome partitioning protein